MAHMWVCVCMRIALCGKSLELWIQTHFEFMVKWSVQHSLVHIWRFTVECIDGIQTHQQKDAQRTPHSMLHNLYDVGINFYVMFSFVLQLYVHVHVLTILVFGRRCRGSSDASAVTNTLNSYCPFLFIKSVSYGSALRCHSDSHRKFWVINKTQPFVHLCAWFCVNKCAIQVSKLMKWHHDVLCLV